MFDPLHKWLGIPPDEQPPNHYRLLGITIYENDPDVIDMAADKQLAFLHDLTNGEQAEMAEQLSNQVSAARLCLLNDEKKIAYDDALRNALAKEKPVEARPAMSLPNIDPSVEMPHPTSRRRGAAPNVRIRKRRRPAKSATSGWTYSRLSTLMCIVALALIGIGVKQGRFAIDLSWIESLGLMRATDPAAKPITQDLTPRHAATKTPPPSLEAPSVAAANATANRDSSPRQLPTPEPPAQPSRPSIPSPQPHQKSIADLAHSSTTAEASVPQIEKSPLPSQTELEQKMSLVRELYEDNYRNAKTRAEKIELAKLMHRDGQETTDDAAGRYALWQVAHDIFTREGEYALALGIVDNLNAHYSDVDSNRLKSQSLRDAASHLSAAQINSFLDAVISVVTNCGQQDQFELAKSLAAFASEEFGSRTAKSRLAALQEISSQIEAREQKFNEYLAALETLKKSKDDPEANQKVGQYLCFVRGQWDQGLGPLALGADAELRSAAVRELASQSGPTDAMADAMAVADGWYRIADQTSASTGQTNLHLHAYQWYKRAEPNSQGLDLKKIQARLAELQALVADELDESSVAGTSAPSKVLGYRVKTSTESKSDFANRKGNEFTLGMGPRPDGRGEAAVGIELSGVKQLKIVGSASQKMAEIDPFSKVGFVIDYHTPGGYSKRIFLGLDLRPGRQFSDAPPWGAVKLPDLILDIGRSDSYEVDLTRWAPSTWDGQSWFTIYMQNAGANRTLFSTVSW